MTPALTEVPEDSVRQIFHSLKVTVRLDNDLVAIQSTDLRHKRP